jgi:acetolactate synthase I/II/III large subunit
MIVSRVIYKKLLEKNIKHVFGYSGGANLPLLNEFYQSEKIHFIKNSNESCSGFAAEGYSKSLMKMIPGVVLTTSGPGITNLITPLQNAYSDGTPLVVLSAQVPMSSLYTDAFQECRATNLTQHCTKWNTMITDPYTVSETIDKAFKIAMTDRKGPVHVDIPKDVLLQSSSMFYLKKSELYIRNIKYNSMLCDVFKIIQESKKPVLCVGQGCNDISKELTLFAEKNHIPVVSTIHGMGVLSESHELSYEMCGMHGNPVANIALQEADLIIGIGTRFDDRITGKLSLFGKNARNKYGIIHIDSSAKQVELVRKNFRKHFSRTFFLQQLTMDSKRFINCINEKETNYISERQQWTHYLDSLKKKYSYYTGGDKKELYTPDVIQEINTCVDELGINRDNMFVTTGVGNHQMWAAQHITWTSPSKMITSGSLGTMGVGVPFAIGCHLANPQSFVLCIDGDSSFNMTSNELQTILENQIPIKIAIMNDKRQQMVHVWQQLFHQNRIVATENVNPDYTLLGKSYQITTMRCQSKKSLKKTIHKFMKHSGPAIAVFDVKPSMCFPLVSPGKALDDMILTEKDVEMIDKNENAPN